MTLTEKLRARLEFDYMGAVNSSLRWDALNRGGYELFKDGAEYEHARLAPLHEKLLAIVSSADDAIAQIKTQRGLWPAEVDTLEDALAAIQKEVGE